jgi:chromosome segregation ATPase
MKTPQCVGIGLAILTCIGVSHVESEAASSIAVPSPQGAGGTQSLVAQIQELAAEFKSLSQELLALLEQLDQLRSSKPQPPPNNASPATNAAYAKALHAWEHQVQALEQQIQMLQARIGALDQKLARLASHQLPAADKKDIAVLQKALVDAKNSLGRAMATATSLNPPSGEKSVPQGALLPSPSGLR